MKVEVSDSIASIKPKKHLAIFIPNFDGGGAEKVMVTVASKLAERGHRVDMVVASGEGPTRALLSDSVNVIDLNAKRIGTSVFSLAGYLRKQRPDALLSALGHANIAAIIARKLARVDTRVAVSERNCMSKKSKNSSDLKSKLLPFMASMCYPSADVVLAVSRGVADDLSSAIRFPRDQIKVVYNPTITPSVLTEAQVRPDHPWFQIDSPPVVIGIGRLNEQKDFPTLIRAFGLVHERQESRLLILGEGPNRSQLEALVQELNLTTSVSLPGYVKEPYGYLAHSECYVLSSKYEGLPGGLIEALACGTSIVSTDCESGPDEILESGKYGFLCPVGDVQAMASQIERVLRGEGIHPPTESWNLFCDDFAVDQYEDVLLEML